MCRETGLGQKPSLPGNKLWPIKSQEGPVPFQIIQVRTHSPLLVLCLLGSPWFCQACLWTWTRISHSVYQTQIGSPRVANLHPPIRCALGSFLCYHPYILCHPLLSLDYLSTHPYSHQRLFKPPLGSRHCTKGRGYYSEWSRRGPRAHEPYILGEEKDKKTIKKHQPKGKVANIAKSRFGKRWPVEIP